MALIYTEKEPPIYWSIIGKELENYDRGLTCFEIGSGAGDVLSLLIYLGFKSVYGIEMNESLAQIANEKIIYFFGEERGQVCMNDQFPIPLDFAVEILVMVNCVYWEGCNSKQDYLEKVLKYYKHCGEPSLFLWEVIDDNEQSEKYPRFVRTSFDDVEKLFGHHRIIKIDTYQWPRNTSSKSLYIIKKIEE